jgi:hypothetical protein
MQLTPQQQRVLNYMKENGSINPLQSLMDCSVYRLSDVIYKLREHFKIDTKMTTSKNKYNEDCKYATYVFKGVK